MTFSQTLRPQSPTQPRPTQPHPARPHVGRLAFSGDTAHDDFLDVPDVDSHLPTPSSETASSVPASAQSPASPQGPLLPQGPGQPRIRFVLTLVVAGLAGLLAGVDIIGIALLELVLKGAEADFVHVPGVAYAGWSFDAGFGYGFGPGAVAILAATVGLGVALGWVIARRRAGARA